MEMTDIIAKPFDWNDNLSKEALEDFEGIQKDLPYCTCQSIGMALAKLELLEKQGYKVIEPSVSSSEKPNKCEDAISRETVLKIIDGWYEQNRDTDNIEDLIVLITYMDSVNPQKTICPSAGIDCEDCPAYEKKTGWIPVSERLPEKYTYTLWCASSGYVRSDYFNGEFWEDAKKLGYEVIAWMPLPEPYKAEGSDEE